jgi:hypothetical protein
MSLDVGRHRLVSAHTRLLERWEETSRAWQDLVRADFAREHVEPLGQMVHTTLAAIDQLARVLGRVRQDCGDG